MNQPDIIPSQAEIFAAANFAAVSVNNKKQLIPSSVSKSCPSDHLINFNFSYPVILLWLPVNKKGWLY